MQDAKFAATLTDADPLIKTPMSPWCPRVRWRLTDVFINEPVHVEARIFLSSKEPDNIL